MLIFSRTFFLLFKSNESKYDPILLLCQVILRYAQSSSLRSSSFATLSAGVSPPNPQVRFAHKSSLRSELIECTPELRKLSSRLCGGKPPEPPLPKRRPPGGGAGILPGPRQEVPRPTAYPRYARGPPSCSTSWREMGNASH